LASPEILEKMDEGELSCANFMHHLGDVDSPQLFELKVPPNTELAPHAHGQDEIIYITEGEIHVGRRVLKAGSSVFVGKHTLYSLKAGPEGARFLNFRPRMDGQYITKAEFLEMRSGASEE
jgi:quercetin dioxygenase-like cupin family protein